jgi:hypothetical protein
MGPASPGCKLMLYKLCAAYPVPNGPQAGLGHGDHGASLNDGVKLVGRIVEASDHDLATLGVQQREACSQGMTHVSG